MSKHNDKAFTAMFKSKLRDGFKEQFQSGLAQGTYAACKVLHDKATDESKTPEERIRTIVQFCETFLKGKIGSELAAKAEGESSSES